MTSAANDPSFRLLDARTGWELAASFGLSGLADPGGVRLASRAISSDVIHVADLYRCLVPATVAIDPAGRLFRKAVGDHPDQVQVLNLRAGCWEKVVLPGGPASISALSWGGDLLGVVDARARRIFLLRGTPLREALRVDLAGQVEGRPHLLAITPWSLLVVVTLEPAEVVLVGMDGLVRRRSSLPATAAAAELGLVHLHDQDGDRTAVLLAVRSELGWRRLLCIDVPSLAATVVAPSALCCPPRAGLRIEAGDDESWRIDPSDDPDVQPVRRYVQRGQLRTVALDSGVEDCTWHRVGLDADQPRGTRVSLRLATLRTASDTPKEHEWQVIPSGALDALVVGRRPGRFLRLELELLGDGRDTPVVRAIRADFNVQTGLDRLPAVYRGDAATAGSATAGSATADPALSTSEVATVFGPLVPDPQELPDHLLPALAGRMGIRVDPSWRPDQLRRMLIEARAAEFTRRFLSLFEASLQDIDEAIAFAPLLLDPNALPDYVLPALTARIGIRADPSWPPERLRRLLATWPLISPLVGTPRGLRRLVAVVHGIDVIVEEHGRRRPWGAAGHARLGQVRLFGLSRASLRLGVGRLGEALIEPGADRLGPAYGSGAYRCTVHVPASLPTKDRPAMESLIRAFLPADVSVTVTYTFPAVRVGPPLAINVGTRLGGLQPGALVKGGERALVLGRQGVLGAGCGGVVVTVGRRSVVGITT
jgi:phage tail-like protein